jgi:hypothetical protein
MKFDTQLAMKDIDLIINGKNEGVDGSSEYARIYAAGSSAVLKSAKVKKAPLKFMGGNGMSLFKSNKDGNSNVSYRYNSGFNFVECVLEPAKVKKAPLKFMGGNGMSLFKSKKDGDGTLSYRYNSGFNFVE